MDKTLIKGAVLVNPALPARVIQRGWLLIAGERIEALGPGDPPQSLEQEPGMKLDAEGGILLPGLVNLHTHAAMSILRGLADDLPLREWLENHIFPAEARAVNEEFVFWGTLLSCAEMLLSGTTTFADGYFHEDMALDAAKASGIRAVLAQGVLDFPAPGCPDPSLNVENAIKFLNRSWGEDQLRPAVFCHSPYTCSPETIRKAKEACCVHGVLFFIHAAETQWEVHETHARYGLGPLEHLARLGVLDPATVLVHGVWLSQRERELVADSGAGIAVCTESNMKLASGIAPLTDLLKSRVRVGLGTDGAASNNDLDMFGEMNLTAKLHKVAASDPTALDASTVLHLATRGGATILGMDDVGLLEPGFQADLILVRTDRPHMQPLYNPVSQLVYSARGSDVEHVWVKGRQLVKGRRILSFHVEEVLQKARLLAQALITSP